MEEDTRYKKHYDILVICPVCQKNNQKSTCEQTDIKILSQSNQFYDENGKHHSHGVSLKEVTYNCSSNHLFLTHSSYHPGCISCKIKCYFTMKYI